MTRVYEQWGKTKGREVKDEVKEVTGGQIMWEVDWRGHDQERENQLGGHGHKPSEQ